MSVRNGCLSSSVSVSAVRGSSSRHRVAIAMHLRIISSSGNFTQLHLRVTEHPQPTTLSTVNACCMHIQPRTPTRLIGILKRHRYTASARPRPKAMSYTPRSSFPLALPPADLAIPPPVYRRPALITTYSHLPDRSIQHDDSSMAYYSPAPLGIDLNYGFERRTERDESIDEHLDGLCEALREVEERGDQAERRGGIITWRGMVTRCVCS